MSLSLLPRQVMNLYKNRWAKKPILQGLRQAKDPGPEAEETVVREGERWANPLSH